MKAARAREIIRDIEALSGNRKEYPLAYFEAAGYLSALEGPEVRALQERVKELEGALELSKNIPELNMANYTDDEVAELNGIVTEICLAQESALAKNHIGDVNKKVRPSHKRPRI